MINHSMKHVTVLKSFSWLPNINSNLVIFQNQLWKPMKWRKAISSHWWVGGVPQPLNRISPTSTNDNQSYRNDLNKPFFCKANANLTFLFGWGAFVLAFQTLKKKVGDPAAKEGSKSFGWNFKKKIKRFKQNFSPIASRNCLWLKTVQSLVW